jgi:hypothetical protein
MMMMIIIIITKAKYKYYIFNTTPIEECDKRENIGVTGAAATSCLKRALLNIFPILRICPVTVRLAPQ